MVEADALPPLVQLLSSANIDVAEQAVWAVGNIAGDHPKMRDRVLAQNALPLLCAFLERVAAEGKISPTRNGTWALSNLVRGKPQPQLKDVAPAVPLLAKLLTLDDSEVHRHHHRDAAWAISYLSDGPNEMIDTVCMAGAVPRLVELCKSGPLAVRLPGIRAISSMMSGSDEATQHVLDHGILEMLPAVLQSAKMQTRKEACWAMSNVAAGTPAQLDLLMNTPLPALVIERFAKDEFDVKKEAGWVVANAMHSYQSEPGARAAAIVARLVELGCIAPMVSMLEANDATMQKLMLDAMTNMMAAGKELGASKGVNVFAVAMDEAEGIDALEKLQEHENEEVYSKAVHLSETYFGAEEEEDENLAPNATSSGFAFGLAAPPAVGATAFGQPAAQPAFAF